MAQPMLYLANGQQVPGQIIGISPKEVIYLPEGGTSNKSMPKEDVLLAFNQKGDYLVMTGSVSQQAIAEFLNASGERRGADVLIARNGRTVACLITAEDLDYIHYLARGGLAFKAVKNQLACAIRKDGKHQVFGEISSLAPTLSLAQPQIKTSIDALGSVEELKRLAADTAGRAGSEVDLALFERKALSKVEDLGRYVKKIADKNTPVEESNQSIDLACALFLSEDAQVEITQGASEDKKRYPIRRYLNLLKLLHYENVRVSYAEINYVSRLRKGPDGNYYGIVTFTQTFEALNEDRVVYRDVTKKNVEIVLKTFKKQMDGKEETVWDVFLNDIAVEQTRVQGAPSPDRN